MLEAFFNSSIPTSTKSACKGNYNHPSTPRGKITALIGSTLLQVRTFLELHDMLLNLPIPAETRISWESFL